MRIMTSNYIKSVEFEKRYRNRDQQDVIQDDEYVKFKEEETNTKKMSTILKNLNSPRRRTASFNQRKQSKTDRSMGRNMQMANTQYSHNNNLSMQIKQLEIQ